MKRLILTSVIVGVISSATANADPAREGVMDPKTIMKQSVARSGGDVVLPLLILAIIAAIASSSGATVAPPT